VGRGSGSRGGRRDFEGPGGGGRGGQGRGAGGARSAAREDPEGIAQETWGNTGRRWTTAWTG
jgi:hypothetical protein